MPSTTGENSERRDLLETCQRGPGVQVIDRPVDDSDKERLLNRAIKERAARVETTGGPRPAH